jgi:iron complex outermembrane receptor protein
MKKIRFLLIIGIFGFSKITVAQNDTLNTNDLFDMDLEQLMKIEVVSSTKTTEKISDAPNIISVYSSDQIKAYGWKSMNDVLSHHPGFYPTQDYERRTVGARGLFEGWNNNHLLLLIDGVPFNDNLYGTAYTWEITPLIFTKSFEVIRGPGAALYGTSATNGVLTLNTASYEDFGNKRVIANAQYGEKNTQTYDVLSGFQTKHFSNVSSLTFNKTDGENYQSYDAEINRSTVAGFHNKFETKDERSSGYIFTKFEGNNGLKGLSLQYHFQYWDFKTGHGWLFEIPDKPETMKEYRSIAVLKYNSSITENLSHEIVLRHQKHAIDWDMFYYRTHSFDDFYPEGANEYLKTSGQDVFARWQFHYLLPKNASLLAAAEGTVFYYNGDKKHTSNIDLNDTGGFNLSDGTPVPSGEGWFAPYPDGHRNQESWLEFVKGKTVNNLGGFLQFSSGKMLGDFAKLTAGIRYDNEFFKYTDIYDNHLEKNKKFEQFSPRLAIVIKPLDKLSVKLMGGTAYRAPTPTEMFGSNTWTLASNISELKPEKVKTAEIGIDYSFTEKTVVRLTGFYTQSKGQIAYSLGNFNLSSNIYDLTNAGGEAEFLLSTRSFTGFYNISLVKRLDESIFEPEKPFVSEEKTKVTWVPAFCSNAGFAYTYNNIMFSAVAHYQGNVARREKDLYTSGELATIGVDKLREDELDSWISVDAKLTYTFKFAEFGIFGKNLTDGKNYLVKNLKYPFDYQMEGRRIGITLMLKI